MRDYLKKKVGYCPYGDELFIQMIKFSQERQKIHSPKSSVVRTNTGNVGNPVAGCCSPAGKARPSCGLLLPRCRWRPPSSMLFCLFFLWKVCWHLLSSQCGKGLKFSFCFMVGIIQARSCHWGLSSFRHLGSPLLGEPAEKQSYWILGGSRVTSSIIPFRKTSSKLNYVMALSSFRASAGQVGAGPRSEQYPLWVMGWGKDRSALFQEIPGNAGAPLNMSTGWLHHHTCQKPPWLSHRMMQLSVPVLQRYPLILNLHVRILKRHLLNNIILVAFCPMWGIPLTVKVGKTQFSTRVSIWNPLRWKSTKFLWVNLKGTHSTH